MKKPVQKILLFIAGYYIFTILVCFVCAFFIRQSFSILPIFALPYFVNRSLHFFVDIFPAVQLSAVLIGFSWFFKDFFLDGNVLKHALRIKLLRSVFTITIITLAFSIVFVELAAPLLRTARRDMESNTADYDDLMNFARALINGRQYVEADPFVQQALVIYPSSQEALYLKRTIEDAYPDYVPPPVQHKESVMQQQADGLSFAELLRKARDAYASKSYIDAHYYATLALRSPDTHSTQEARGIASDSWNKIIEVSSSAMDETTQFFARKKQGYLYILQGDYLAAYYLFSELSGKYANDPDIARYLALSSDLLLSECFFIDETYNLRSFESMRRIYFSIKRPDGGTDIVYISGLSRVKNSSGLVQYLRGLQINRFDSLNRFDFSLSVDYAKLFSEQAADFGSTFSSYFKDPAAVGSVVPVIQLVSVDRKTRGIVQEPVYTFGQKNVEFFNTYVLPLPYGDFLLLAEASAGAINMSLSSLWKFIPLAEKYGYSFEVFYQTLCSRLCYPLFILLLTMVAIVFAWQFRLSPASVIKFSWLLALPFCTMFCLVVTEFLQYIFKLFVYTLIGFFKWYALPITVVCLVAGFALISILFAAQTHE